METIRIVNPIQAGKYTENGVKPIDIYWNEGKWVWLFNKEETKEIWEKWRKRELQ